MTSSADRRVGCPRPTAPGGRNGRPNGEMLAYTSFAEGKPYRVMVQRVDSDRPPVPVAESSTRLTPSTWSPDGRRLTFYEFPTNRISAVSIQLDGSPSSPPQPMSFMGATHDLSPDGRWLVYADAGINVRALPVGEHVQKISDIGSEPKWCRTCNEIVFRSGNRWFSHRSAGRFVLRLETAADDPANPVQRQSRTVIWLVSRRPTDPRREAQGRAAQGHDPRDSLLARFVNSPSFFESS